MRDNAINIKFELTNAEGCHYMAESEFEVFYDLGDTELSAIGEQLNAFLSQCGYIRKNNFIFMEDITEEEYDLLGDYLNEIRKGDNSNDN